MPRSALLDKLTSVLLYHGYAGASLANFSAETGLSKASLYHFFPDGKHEIARQCLARSGMKLQRLVISPLQTGKAPVERLSESFAGVLSYYAGPRPGCLMNLLGSVPDEPVFTSDIAAGMGAWRSALQAVLTAGGVAAERARALTEEALEQIQGALVMCRINGSRAPLESRAAALNKRLASQLR